MLYVVSGFMRSGTSMMMAALEAGGMEIVRSKFRDETMLHGVEDEDYSVNEGGLRELTVSEMKMPFLVASLQNVCIKIVAPFLTALPNTQRVKVLFMHRDCEEIKQSYDAAFMNKQHGEYLYPGPSSYSAEKVREVTEGWRSALEYNYNATITDLDYRSVLQSPRETMELLTFNRWPIDPAKAAAIIKPELCRFKKEKLVVGL